MAVCPFHDDHNPSFCVFPSTENTWMWKCRSRNECGTGNVFQFVQRFDSLTFGQAAEKIAQEVLTDWDRDRERVEQTFQAIGGPKKPLVRYPLDQYRKFEDALLKAPSAREWLLKERGITFSTAQKFHIGYRQDLGRIAGESAAAAGWIAIPEIRGQEVVAIKYRSIAEKDFRRQPGMETVLFNSQTIDPFEPVLVVEGEFDALVLEQAGFRAVSIPNATAALTPEMKDLLMQAECRVLAGDSDSAGRGAMDRLWRDLQDGTYKLTWPAGCKDANDAFTKTAGGDPDRFRDMVSRLVREARGRPMDHVVSLQSAMLSSGRTNMSDHPDRLRFPWPNVDKMVNILPGGVLALFATDTGMGKTSLVANILIHEAKRGEVVLNYSDELSPEEYSNLVVAHILKKDRNELTPEDYERAATKIGKFKFYIGRNRDLSTADEVLDLIEAAIRRLGATLVVIDHFHIIVRGVRDQVRAQEDAMKRILKIADKYNVKIINIGQPRKANSQQRGKRAYLTDAKGSGSFGEDAHGAMLLHRNHVRNFDPANPPREPFESKTEIHLLKGRSQGTGSAYAELLFIGNIATFACVVKDEPRGDAPLFRQEGI